MMLGQVMSNEETEVFKWTMYATPCACMMHWTVWTTESRKSRCDAVLLGALSLEWELGDYSGAFDRSQPSALGVVLTHVRPETNPAG
jgi:hypothetical protein